MVAQTIYSKFVKKIPEHIYLLGVKHEFSLIEIQVMAWNQTKTFMELNKSKFKQLEYKNNISYILENVKKLKA
jgi:hypothetical protein